TGTGRAALDTRGGLLARDRPSGATRRGKTPRRVWARREGVRVQRDAGQVAGAASSVSIDLVERALAAQRAAGGMTFQPPYYRANPLPADAQRHLGAGDHKRAREATCQYRPAGSARRGGRWRWHLRQLINAPLQGFLIGAQISQFVRSRGRQPCCKYDNG